MAHIFKELSNSRGGFIPALGRDDWWENGNSGNHISQQDGDPRKPGLRGIIIYPMNALVEDQLRRLRMALDSEEMHNLYSRMFGAKVRYAKEQNFKPSVQSIIDSVNRKTKIVFLANPNNPTGTYLDASDLLDLRKKLRSDILLVIDDAYHEFITDPNYSSGLKLFAKSQNVLVTRTFSKIYGLAGLRIGWGYGPKKIIKKLYEIKPPFNVSRPALFAATQAVKDTKWLNKAIKHNNFWAKKIFEVLDEIGISTNKTNVNFFLLNFDFVNQTALQVFNKLANSGILVRQMDVYSIKNSLRVTIGNSRENKKFISVLRRIFNV